MSTGGATIEAALGASIPRGTVLMSEGSFGDAGYGDEAAMRDRLTAHGLPYAVGIRLQTAVWCDQTKRDQPLSVLELARTLPPASYRTISWREGTNQRLSSRFTRVRVRTAHGKRTREEEWLLIECGTHVAWPKGAAEPTRYFLSTLPEDVSFKKLVAAAKMRWRIERDYLELKQEVGLGHYEGRNWRGFHHHARRVYRRLWVPDAGAALGKEKTPLDSKRLPYPEASARAGLGPMQRHIEWSIASVRSRAGSDHRPASSAMSVLRETVRAGS